MPHKIGPIIGYYCGYQESKMYPCLTHLFFADDALMFFRATSESCGVIRQMIDDFCHLSGQMVSFKKFFVMFSENTPSSFVHCIRKLLGVRSRDKVESYMGCPMEVTGRNYSVFPSLVDFVHHRISSWQFSHLSPTGRLLLANNVRVSMVSHLMYLFLIPKKITNPISSAMMRLWWRGASLRKPIFYRNPSLLYTHKNEGGLGLRNIGYWNVALSGKQCLRIHSQPNYLLSQVICERYGGSPLSLVSHVCKPSIDFFHQ